jgi:hypothetical protein
LPFLVILLSQLDLVVKLLFALFEVKQDFNHCMLFFRHVGERLDDLGVDETCLSGEALKGERDDVAA